MLQTTQSWSGKPLKYPQGQAEVTVLKIEIAPGGQTGWHLHGVPSFAVITQGRLDVRLKDGRIHHVKAGDAMAEVVDTLHNGRNVGKLPVKLIVFYAGAKGCILTKKCEPARKR
jgi:quercetin dioxygenase-like cupin family protein